MKSTHAKNALQIVAVLCMLLSTNCSEIQNLLGQNKEDEKETIPEDVLDLAEGVFGLIGLVFESESSDPTVGPYPTGMTVSWIAPQTQLQLAFVAFTPPDDTSGTLVNGSIVLTQTNDTPITMTFAGSLTMTNHVFGSTSINATALWPAGATEPGGDDPSSVTGTLTVDGDDYDIAAVREALEDRENDDPPPSEPSFPISDIYKGAELHSALRNGLMDFSTIFYISQDGLYYSMDVGDERICEGSIKWFMDSGYQLLHFYDNAEANDRLFVVMESYADHLILNIGSGPQVVQWRFNVVRYD